MMKPAALSDIRQELIQLPPKKVLEICLRLAKYKKENKELLSYLLFEAEDETGFVNNIKKEMDDLFSDLPKHSVYLLKKGLRKILKLVTKHSKHTSKKESEIEMLLYFCQKFVEAKFAYRNNKAIESIYLSQIKKTSILIQSIHQDLQHDYTNQLNQLPDGHY